MLTYIAELEVELEEEEKASHMKTEEKKEKKDKKDKKDKPDKPEKPDKLDRPGAAPLFFFDKAGEAPRPQVMGGTPMA